MSSVIVEVVAVDEVLAHPNADRLFIARVKGWQTVIQKREDGSPQFSAGEKVVYIPPDSTLPLALAERLKVLPYLSERTDAEGDKVLVVRRVRLRGEPSYGFAVKPDDADWPLGQDVREHYGIGKFMPPVKFGAGDSEPSHALFDKYTEIENLRNFPEVLCDGEEVVITEKIHGTNARIGYLEGTLVAGSHKLQRKRPEPDDLGNSTYWFPSTLAPVMSLLDELREGRRQAILFGEVYGRGIQSLHYGKKGGLGFAVFDALADGTYLPFDELQALCAQHDVPMVPVLARGPYSLALVRRHSSGKTSLADNHIREGVVVRPISERHHPKIGRVILKYLSDEYLLDDKLSAADATDA